MNIAKSFLILKKIERDIIRKIYFLHIKYVFFYLMKVFNFKFTYRNFVQAITKEEYAGCEEVWSFDSLCCSLKLELQTT
jgi:hypothetical protein